MHNNALNYFKEYEVTLVTDQAKGEKGEPLFLLTDLKQERQHHFTTFEAVMNFVLDELYSGERQPCEMLERSSSPMRF